MRLRDLVDLLEEVKSAQDDVAEATRALGFGGNPDTMARKQYMLEHTQRMLESLLDQQVEA